MADCDVDPEENLLQKHKKEKKELQSQIQKLKHSVSKGEKKKKKEITEQIAQLEADLDKKHEQELKELQEGKAKTEPGTVSDVNDSMGHLTIDHDDGDTGGLATKEVKAKKPSKAQKRRDKKAALESEREARIQEQEIENLTSSRHLEAVQIKTLLAHRGLQIHEIPSDGNCLYAAIVHQLKLRDMEGTTEKLRQQVAQYMRDHEDSFMPFLTKDNGDSYTHDLCSFWYNTKVPVTANIYRQDSLTKLLVEDFLEYCDLVADTPAWGGQLEIRALSTVLETPVEVIQSEGPPIVSGEEFPAKPFILTYYRHAYGLGEHYHSVEDRVEEEEDEFT